jgi:hypothetical protein
MSRPIKNTAFTQVKITEASSEEEERIHAALNELVRVLVQQEMDKPLENRRVRCRKHPSSPPPVIDPH